MVVGVLVGDRVIGMYMHHAWLTHTFHHTSPILSLMYWKAQCMNALVYYHLRMYTSTRYSSSPLCEHIFVARCVGVSKAPTVP